MLKVVWKDSSHWRLSGASWLCALCALTCTQSQSVIRLLLYMAKKRAFAGQYLSAREWAPKWIIALVGEPSPRLLLDTIRWLVVVVNCLSGSASQRKKRNGNGKKEGRRERQEYRCRGRGKENDITCMLRDGSTPWHQRTLLPSPPPTTTTPSLSPSLPMHCPRVISAHANAQQW